MSTATGAVGCSYEQGQTWQRESALSNLVGFVANRSVALVTWVDRGVWRPGSPIWLGLTENNGEITDSFKAGLVKIGLVKF